MLAFGFVGIEAVAVTAFEARSSKSLRLPSQCIAYVTLFLYFLCLLSQFLNVSSFDLLWNRQQHHQDGRSAQTPDIQQPNHHRLLGLEAEESCWILERCSDLQHPVSQQYRPMHLFADIVRHCAGRAYEQLDWPKDTCSLGRCAQDWCSCSSLDLLGSVFHMATFR
jgi:hypothetical protein